MLANVCASNLALIRKMSVDFAPGFSVLTGETGAGKSLILDSLNLFLQNRVARDKIRRGEERLSVSLFFQPIGAETFSRLAALFPELEDEKDEGVTLSRTVEAEGKSVCKLNGRTIPFSMATKAACLLFAIHGQHDSQGLLDEKTHISYLDSAFSEDENAVLSEYREKYRLYLADKARLFALEEDKTDPQDALALYDYQINEIQKARLRPGEEETLTRKMEELRSFEKISSALRTAAKALNGGEKGRGAAFLVEIAGEKMEALAGFEKYAALSETLKNLACEVRSAAEEAAALSFEFDEEDPGDAMDKMTCRLDTIWRLKSKYGKTEEEILEKEKELRRRKDEIFFRADEIKKIKQDLSLEKRELDRLAARISGFRRAKAAVLETEILSVLSFLDMPQTKIQVRLSEAEDFTPSGKDRAEFYVCTNAGEGFGPLSRIASGGELSRIMLALQIRLPAAKDAETLVFDEIDTGISGSTSQKIGVCLKILGIQKQVLCVTHSAQVAALSDHHFKVVKTETEGRTATSVACLSDTESTEELARILGGAVVTDKARQNARALADEGAAQFEKLKDSL